MNEMNQSKKRDNSLNVTNDFSLSVTCRRCSVAEQCRSVSHQVTAKGEWTKDLNVFAIACYFLNDPVGDRGRPIRGYRQRIHEILKETSPFELSEQNLCDRARAIILEK